MNFITRNKRYIYPAIIVFIAGCAVQILWFLLDKQLGNDVEPLTAFDVISMGILYSLVYVFIKSITKLPANSRLYKKDKG